MISLNKWGQTIIISWSKIMAYRVDFVLQILGPSLVFLFIKLQLWSSIFEQHPEPTIQGYTLPEMLNYHLWAMVVTLLSQGVNSYNLSQEIRHGKISTYLIYPFDFWEFHSAYFLAFQLRQLVTVCIMITVMHLTGILHLPNPTMILTALGYCFFIGIFWFAIQYWAGLMAFWLDETWILRVLLTLITSFLSGAIIPLDLYPEWSQVILKFTPFPYMNYLPITYLMGRETSMLNGYFVLGFWLSIFMLFNSLLWKKGIRQYTAAGM